LPGIQRSAGTIDIKNFPIVAYNEKQDAYLVIWQDQRNKTPDQRYVRIYGKLKKIRMNNTNVLLISWSQTYR